MRAAGGVVRRIGAGGAEVLLVHRPRYDDWTFPKGKAERDEADEATALREVEEETGLRCVLIAELPSTSYRDSRGRDKVVRYWTMRPDAGEFVPDDEVDAISWVSTSEAAQRLSYDRDHGVLEAVSPPVLILRHASARDRSDWKGDDAGRPLDDRGRRQAEGLVDQLAPFEIARIVSSPFVRCVQTVEPLAEALGRPLEVSDDLAEGAEPSRVRFLLGELAATGAVVCGHAPELEPLIGRSRKASSVAVEVANGQPTELGRLPAPPSG